MNTTDTECDPNLVPAARLLQTIADYQQVVILTHDNPDPDAIASGWGLAELFEAHLDLPVRFVAGGAISRAENRHLIETLNPPLELVERLDLPEGSALVLVDCEFGTSHQLTPTGCMQPVAVIDHHLPSQTSAVEIPFTDRRQDVAATVSIIAEYFRTLGISPSTELSTAMVYAIRTETRGCETAHTALDCSAVAWLSALANPSLIAEIESAPLPVDYFENLAMALQNTQLFGDTAFCLLPQAAAAETVGEVADLLIRGMETKRVLCAVVMNDQLLVSVRTDRDDEDSARLVQQTLLGWGRGGGHQHRAGGKVSSLRQLNLGGKKLRNELLARWLVACGSDASSPSWLVDRGEIARNLRAHPLAIRPSGLETELEGSQDPEMLMGWREWVSLPDLDVPAIKTKIDSGSRTSSLHAVDIYEFERNGQQMVRFQLYPHQRDDHACVICEVEVIEHRHVTTADGDTTLRPVILTEVEWQDLRWPIEMILTNRNQNGFRMLLGREAIRGRFQIDAERSYHGGLPPRRLRRSQPTYFETDSPTTC